MPSFRLVAGESKPLDGISFTSPRAVVKALNCPNELLFWMTGMIEGQNR